VFDGTPADRRFAVYVGAYSDHPFSVVSSRGYQRIGRDGELLEDGGTVDRADTLFLRDVNRAMFCFSALLNGGVLWHPH
jgi:hypothetical protein